MVIWLCSFSQRRKTESLKKLWMVKKRQKKLKSKSMKSQRNYSISHQRSSCYKYLVPFSLFHHSLTFGLCLFKLDNVCCLIHNFVSIHRPSPVTSNPLWVSMASLTLLLVSDFVPYETQAWCFPPFLMVKGYVFSLLAGEPSAPNSCFQWRNADALALLQWMDHGAWQPAFQVTFVYCCVI